jgi:hypothetical protein
MDYTVPTITPLNGLLFSQAMDLTTCHVVSCDCPGSGEGQSCGPSGTGEYNGCSSGGGTTNPCSCGDATNT